MRLHSTGDTGLIKILEWSRGSGRSRGCTLEDIFQVVIMIDVESADSQHLFGAFQLASDEAIFATGVGPQCQSTVGPELSLGPEAIRRLYQSDQQSGADRANRRNLLQ